MKKLGTDLKNNITLAINDAELLSIPVIKAYSWGYIMEKQTVLFETIEYLKKWYQKQGDIKNVIENIQALWDTLIDYVAEKNVQDFIDQGELGYSKKTLLSGYNDHKKPFQEGYIYIAKYWLDVSADEAQKQLYREARKENRARLMSINFGGGLLGGVKALASTGLANVASEMAHSAVNAIGNSMGSISKNIKLDNFYSEDDSLNSLIDGWTESFWLIMDEQIDFINSIFIDNKKAKILSYSYMIGFKQSAESMYSNMYKMKSTERLDHFNAIIKCLNEFPFIDTYWSYLFILLFNSPLFNIEMVNSFDKIFIQLSQYIDGLYDSLVYSMIDMMISIHKDSSFEKKQDSVNAIEGVLKEKLNDDVFGETFETFIKDQINDEEIETGTIKHLLLLADKLNIDISEYEDDEEISKRYEKILSEIAYKYSEENIPEIIKEFENGKIDTVIRDVANDPTLEPDNVLTSVIYIINEKAKKSKDIMYSPRILDSINLLKTELKVERNLEELVSYNKLKVNLTSVEMKIKLFNCFMQGINANNPYLLQNGFYWGDKQVPPQIINNFKEYGLTGSEKIFFAFDSSFLQSGKCGILFTTKGLFIKRKEVYRAINLSWDDFVNKYKMDDYEICFWIHKISDKDPYSGYHESAKFGKNFSHLLVNIIAGAGIIFAGKIVKISEFNPIAGAIFDISELEKKLSSDIQIGSNEEKSEETNNKKSFTGESGADKIVTSTREREDYYNFLKEDDRIYKAVKFKEKKGFFRRVLPSSWIVTILFYGFLSICGMIFTSYLASVLDTGVIETISIILGFLALPIFLLIFGIRRRIKYIREKKWWKDCTKNGKKDIQEVFKEFQEMQDKYINNNGSL